MSIMNQNRSHFQAKLGSSLVMHGQGKTAAVEAAFPDAIDVKLKRSRASPLGLPTIEAEFQFNLDAIRARVAITGTSRSITIKEIDYALDHGLLWLHMGRVGYELCVRKGETQRWIDDMRKFAIPINPGYDTRIADYSTIGFKAGNHLFVLSETRPLTNS